MKVLFLSAWYPNRYDAMAGLFVRKHAEAVCLFCDVRVLYVHADEKIDKFEIVKECRSNITELIIYYPVNRKSLIYKPLKAIKFLMAYFMGYKLITKDGFLPEIVHVNILTRTGFIGFLLKIWKNTPYIITEHWSRYLPIRNSYKGIILKLTTQLVVKNAKAILPVSESLKKAMINHKLSHPNYFVVNNVVDNYFFDELAVEPRSKKRILHISCFDEAAKNISGILRAVLQLSKKRQDFEFVFIGTGIDFEKIEQYAQSLNFEPEIIQFLGEKTPKEVANWLQNSDFFVMFSNYENSPVVISESLVCGKPVLSSNVGGISEHIDNSNGFLVNVGDEDALTEKMNFLLDHFQDYDIEKIKQVAQEKFSYKSVGERLIKIYKEAVNEI